MAVLLKILEMIGGLSFFLYGMNVMSSGLGKVTGGGLERSLRKATSNRLLGMVLGAGITIAIQSSSATTVMLVGLVNSGIMSLQQTISVLFGSNIGTTVTGWITSLNGMEGEGWTVLLKPENFAPLFALIGVGLIMMSKKTRRQDLGRIFAGFAILMFGMKCMSSSVSDLKDSPQFANMLIAFENPILGVLVSTVFTGIIQSSAATIGIIQSFALSGQISYSVAIPLVMGANIGTCATALLSSFGVNREAKKVSFVHVLIKIIGTVFCLVVFYGLDAMMDFAFMEATIDSYGVALVHTIFNLINTAILYPFPKQLVKLADLVIRPSKHEKDKVFLDERLLLQPSVAVSEAGIMINKMAVTAGETILSAIDLMRFYDAKTSDAILANEDKLDMYEDKLGTFLVKLSSHSMSEADSRKVSQMLHTIGDFERLGDHAVNLLRSAEEIHEKKITFSKDAAAELEKICGALKEIIQLTIDAFCANDMDAARHVEPLEQVIDKLAAQLKTNHIDRLQAGLCTIQTGFVWSDILTNCERVSDHCSNIAVAQLKLHAGSFETHEYLNEVKHAGDAEFETAYRSFSEKFHL